MWFNQYPEFINLDPRKDREILTVTAESLTKRCQVMLPQELIDGKTILDLGSALGAMGKWSLENSASLYHGVEIQKGYRDKSRELLLEYSTVNIFNTIDEVENQYDIVIAAGIIHGVFNIVELLKNICSKSLLYVIIESHLIDNNEYPSIILREGNMINHSGLDNTFCGMQMVPNRPAIDILMGVNGFILDKELYPEPIIYSHDAYNSKTGADRFISRYVRTDSKIKTLEEAINVGI